MRELVLGALGIKLAFNLEEMARERIVDLMYTIFIVALLNIGLAQRGRGRRTGPEGAARVWCSKPVKKVGRGEEEK